MLKIKCIQKATTTAYLKGVLPCEDNVLLVDQGVLELAGGVAQPDDAQLDAHRPQLLTRLGGADGGAGGRTACSGSRGR